MIRLAKDPAIDGAGFARLLVGGAVAAMALGVAAMAWIWLSAGTAESLVVNAGITAVMVVGFNIFAGNTGIVSFGHPAFVAVGAYAAGIAAVPVSIKAATLPHLPLLLAGVETGFWTALLVGGVAAAALALIIGPIVMRLTGIAAGIMTFGILVIVNEVIRNLDQFTRGTQTFFGVPKAADPLIVYAVVSVAVVVSLAFKFSRMGLRARAVRDDPLAAETVGIDIVRSRVGAWVLSAFVMGVAGALLAHHLTAFSPRSFFISMVIPMLVMAVLAGTGSVIGGLVGVAVVTAWLEFMRNVEAGHVFGLDLPAAVGLSQFTLGIGLILLLWWRPRGLLGSLEVEIGRRRQRVGSDRASRSRKKETSHGIS